MIELTRGDHCRRIASYVKDNPLFHYREDERKQTGFGSVVEGFFTVGTEVYFIGVNRWKNSTAVVIRRVVSQSGKVMDAHEVAELYKEVKLSYEVEIQRVIDGSKVRDSGRSKE